MNLDHDKALTYTLIIFIIIFVVFTCYNSFGLCAGANTEEHYIDIKQTDRPIKYKREEGCKYRMPQVLVNMLEKNGIKETYDDDYVLYFPCTYNNINKEIGLIKPTLHDQRFYIVNNADQLSSKDYIWKNLVKTYGREKAKKIMPETFILYNNKDLKLFKKLYDPKKIYIMKKNIQRQEGLKITKSKKEILNAIKDNYVVVQELLQNPYIISKRKTNMRFYLLLVCKNNEVSAYVHHEGFMYYTKVPFIKGSTKMDPNVTTGYIDRQVYIDNPLTLGDLKKYLDDTGNKNRQLLDIEYDIIENGEKISEYAFNNIYKTLNKVVQAIKDTVCVGSHISPYLSYQLFGVDVALNDKLEAQIMEVNKGPDQSFKDERDGKVKQKVTDDIFKILKVIPNYDDHDFITIYEE